MVKLSHIINPIPDRICSIDASTNSLAFAIFDGGNLTKYGKINFKGMDTYHKVRDSVRKTRAFFAELETIDAIVIEHTIYIHYESLIHLIPLKNVIEPMLPRTCRTVVHVEDSCLDRL